MGRIGQPKMASPRSSSCCDSSVRRPTLEHRQSRSSQLGRQMQQFRQLLRTQRECILHRYASADVPCCAYRVPLAASGLLYSSCGRNRRYPHRCRSRHRNSTMKPSHCRSRIRSPSRPGHIRVRAGFYANSISSQMIFVSIKSDGRIPRCAGPAGTSNRMCTS